MEHKKIAVIGGTGKSGKYLVGQLLNQGYHFKLLIRNPNNFKIKSPLIEVVVGDVWDYESVRDLIKGCYAVVSTLGLGIPASEPTLFSQASTNVIKAMNELNVYRYIVTTGLNVDTPFDNKGTKTANGTEWMKKNFPVSTANKQSEYELLVKSSVDWTLVRLPLIDETDELNEIAVSLQDCAGDKISATSLAHFIIENLVTNKLVKKCPFIANA